jgi:DNA (cytosine-5)-methyltransferase 1
MKYISLFSGIGGFDLGFDKSGMECIARVEKDLYCKKILNKIEKNIPIFEDIKNFRLESFDEECEVICGGFPCQDVSNARGISGKKERLGLAGDRSGLWHEFSRIIDERVPEWVVIENVVGLLSSSGGRDFATIIQNLVNRGYGVCWRVLDLQYFRVPSTRRRVFIVARLSDIRSPAEVLFGKDAIGEVFPKEKTKRNIKPMLVGWDGGLTLERLRGTIILNKRWRKLLPTECEKLMGFPENWTEGISEKERYRKIGNSVSPLITEWIARRIIQVQNKNSIL